MIESERIIHATAPVRFDFGGGPTDVDPFKTIEGGYVINSGVKLSAHVCITEHSDKSITINSEDLNTNERFSSIGEITIDGPLKLIKAAIVYTKSPFGFEVNTKVDVPAGSGMGGSASLAVALLGALKTVKREELVPQTLIDDVLYIENNLLKNINGGQDQCAAALGGFHSFNFDGNGVVIKVVDVSNEAINELTNRSVLCYTGESHLSGAVLSQIMENYTNGDKNTVIALREMKSLTHELEQSLINADIDEFGVLINEIGDRQRSYHPNVHPPYVREIFEYAKQNGAIGGKLAGAGGGGCMFLFCEKGRKCDVETALSQHGIALFPLQFTNNGVSVVCK